jgi:hypothetical protein
MDSFGLNMNFLQIKQVLVFIYRLKNQFLLLITKFLCSLDWAHN